MSVVFNNQVIEHVVGPELHTGIFGGTAPPHGQHVASVLANEQLRGLILCDGKD